MTQLVTGDVAEQTRSILEDGKLRAEWAESDYRLGVKYLSYALGQRKFEARLESLFGK